MLKKQLYLLYEKAWLKLAIALSAIALIGFATVSHYGISTDEPTEIRMVQQNIDFIAKGTPIKSDLVHYGTLFNFLSEGVFRLEEWVRYGTLQHPLISQDNTPCLNYEDSSPGVNLTCKSELERYKAAMTERIRVKHIITFAFSLLGHVAVAGIVGIFCGWHYAWLGAITLAFLPRYWGQVFSNPKDIPFAVLFTMATFLGAYLIEKYLSDDSPKTLGFNRISLESLLYGILLGCLTSVRIGGFLLLFFFAFSYLLVSLSQKGFFSRIIQNIGFYALIVVGWIATTIAWHPASWSNPASWLIAAIQYLSKHAWFKNVLFNGDYIRAADVPWTYLPVWFGITTPLIFWLLFIAGLVLAAVRFRQLSTLQRASLVLVSLQIFALPLVAILRNSTIYDGLRQFSFVLPGMAAIATVGLVWLYQMLPGPPYKLAGATFVAIALGAIAIDMVHLYPYEYTYFNRAFGGLPAAQNRFETDYWGLSVKEAVTWLNSHAKPGDTLVVGTPYQATLISLDSDISLRELEYDYKAMAVIQDRPAIPRPFYFLAIPKHRLFNVFNECELIHQVERQTVPLSTIRYCQ